MAAFATVRQYEARFGPVEDEATLEECLGDASAAIRATLARHGVDCSDPTEELADRLMRACRSVANRIMPHGSDVPVGVTQHSQTAGSYNMTTSYMPSYGTPKLLPSELALLGIGGGARILRPQVGITCGGDGDVADAPGN